MNSGGNARSKPKHPAAMENLKYMRNHNPASNLTNTFPLPHTLLVGCK